MLATGDAVTLRSPPPKLGTRDSVSVLDVSDRSTAGFSGTGVPAGEAFEMVGVSLPGPPYLLAGADTFTEELTESDRGTESLSGKNAEAN